MGAVLDLVRILFEPTAVFERVREKLRTLPLPGERVRLVIRNTGRLEHDRH